MLKLKSALFASVLALACLCHVGAFAQTTLTAGLKAPTKLLLTDGGHLVVAETGTGRNDGRVSIIDPCGNRRTLIDGLPSGLSADGAPSGPTGIALSGATLFVAIGGGDATVRGARQGTEVENPNGPSSPLFSSVLAFELGTDIDALNGSLTLTPNDYVMLKSGARLAPEGGIAVRLLADFPDFVADPITIARTSNPFALAVKGDQLYVADASYNRVSGIDITTGAVTPLLNVSSIANPLPFGGPRLEPVPDGLHVFGEQLLVTLLTGFPFAAGKAEVRAVPLAGGSETTFIGGLNPTIDVVAARTRNGVDQFFALEYSADFLQSAPGRVLRFDAQTGAAMAAPTVLAEGLISPVGLARDPLSGDLFISEIFTGRIMRVEGSELDTFLRDERSGDLLRVNTQTGDYLFVSCPTGVTLSGRARVSGNGCQTELRDGRIAVIIDRCPFGASRRGAALIRLSPVGPTLVINDNDSRSLAKLLAQPEEKKGSDLPPCVSGATALTANNQTASGRVGSYKCR